MKIGDMVRVKHAPTGWFGFGVVLRLKYAETRHCGEAFVHWFDEWSDEEPTDWNKISTLKIISES